MNSTIKTFILALISVSAPAMHLAMAAPFAPSWTVVPVQTGNAGLFYWIKHGALYRVDFGDDTPGVFLYRDNSAKCKVLSDNMDAVSLLIAKELTGTQELETFIRSNLLSVIVALCAPKHTYIISQTYLRNMESVPAAAWQTSAERVAISRGIIRSYNAVPECDIAGNTWTIRAFVTLWNGSVEQWTVRGEVKDFAVSGFKRSTVQKAGSVLPIPEL